MRLKGKPSRFSTSSTLPRLGSRVRIPSPAPVGTINRNSWLEGRLRGGTRHCCLDDGAVLGQSTQPSPTGNRLSSRVDGLYFWPRAGWASFAATVLMSTTYAWVGPQRHERLGDAEDLGHRVGRRAYGSSPINRRSEHGFWCVGPSSASRPEANYRCQPRTNLLPVHCRASLSQLDSTASVEGTRQRPIELVGRFTRFKSLGSC